MTQTSAPIDVEQAWAAFAARDRTSDGRFVVAVRTTGIYCKPSCPARRPAPGNVTFFADGPAAQAAGFRACLRCRPDEVARDHAAVAEAARLISEGEQLPTLANLATAVGYAPHHFQRVFTRLTGISPAAYARALRAERGDDALGKAGSVTDAVYAAGYSTPSRFYAETAPRLGMTPRHRKNGGAGQVIRWTIAPTSLGPLLVAATEKGLCRVAFEEDEAALAARFPAATLTPADEALAQLARQLVALVDEPRSAPADPLPLDIRGTAFQERVWRALADLAPGETVSYTELASRAGNAAAVRAAGSACGANPVAIAVPCHRAKRGNGTLGGYAWGLDRKQALLDRERG
ncbi:bifunctional transcriptional activator/DNA repair enzyme AdaA [Sphingomonas aerophila]|jgi:AraC family transcriptional regulator of adaptative response/methylated-DNA-[protein]-cysteine methyltransferase|uniref:methylated-DNA--[protein]-cysteine S-methyltransferase n=1 Tax=Sphingomonas aerophila TaxID=1344948 RepID=A0A7W9EUJ4_9SPHN|nr:methylated-DNA--[protein]-cysteine S-methyltransferase [Sphingomonas aerophila]MBB5715251.1 AraC family transcriptional regulator of adaptative response/methylated-DNA-[protein]-cysteine methyltransferase [Sphingomonas aerophila]